MEQLNRANKNVLDLTFEKAFARIKLEKDTTRWTVSPKLYSYKKVTAFLWQRAVTFLYD